MNIGKTLIVVAALWAAIATVANAHDTPTPAAPLTGSITVADRWVCHEAVQLDSVTVTDPSGDAVELGSGCTGSIGQINVPTETHGDPIHVGAFAHDLTIADVEIGCQGHDDGKHQDGIQVMGGQRIAFLGGTIACASANNSQFMVHTGTGNLDPPTDITFGGSNTTTLYVDPQGAGAYGMSLGAGTNLTVDNVQLMSHAHRHDCYIGDGAVNASFVNMGGPAWPDHTSGRIAC